MLERILKHFVSVVGVTLTMVTFVSLIASKSVRIWVKSNSYDVFVALIISVAVTFVSIDFVTNRKRREASDHDRRLVANFLNEMPPGGEAMAWLRKDTVWNSIPCAVLDTLDVTLEQIQLDPVGFDNRPVNESYKRLEEAMETYRVHVSLKMFMSSDSNRMSLSSQWPSEQRKEAADLIEGEQGILVAAYDKFLIACHQHRLD